MPGKEEKGISLNKFISDTGRCSRREADKLIELGKVTLNGKIAKKGNRVGINDVVAIDGTPLQRKEQFIYIALNKPVGITSTTDKKDKSNIIDFVNYPKRIFPVGRLDKPSEGLILLTNDGNIVNKILRAGNAHQKEYIVQVDKPITNSFVQKMSNGIPILDTITQKCFVKKEGKFIFRIILTQGLNRQIRRMCKYLGYKVLKLKRIRIMHITIDNLPPGEWRYLTTEEINRLKELVSTSVKTEEASLLQKKDLKN